jgi:hypothetical protein
MSFSRHSYLPHRPTVDDRIDEIVRLLRRDVKHGTRPEKTWVASVVREAIEKQMKAYAKEYNACRSISSAD